MKWSDLSPQKLRKKLRKVNKRRKKLTAKGQAHADLDAQRSRLKKKLAWLKKHPPTPAATPGLGEWKGFQVAGWMVGKSVGPDGKKSNWLQKSVNKGWDGKLSSGYRTPEYSESLCYNMCGGPSCPGKCAGRASNHSQIGPPNWGAIDVFPQYEKFGQIQRDIGSPLRNDLPVDRVHYSFTGR